jgi:hypothetical protein
LVKHGQRAARTKATIEAGTQVGLSVPRRDPTDVTWITLAIEKVGDDYLAHASVIRESNIHAEVFDLDRTLACATLDEAMEVLTSIAQAERVDFVPTALKGQRLFSPAAEVIERHRPTGRG